MSSPTCQVLLIATQRSCRKRVLLHIWISACTLETKMAAK
ncbi:hypothetical protein FKM82_019421 [Ascaphus truei]